jgi:type II secretion system protein G
MANSKWQIANKKTTSKLINQTGFTLIELLVVISIIGILASLIMANFVGVKQRARDGQRKSDLKQIQVALEMYRADVGSYPDTVYTTDCRKPFSYTDVGSGNTATYMKEIPCDPLTPTSAKYYYEKQDSGASYLLSSCLENKNDSQGVSSAPGPNGCSLYFVAKSP